jgi:hypothetical protein
LTVAFANGNIRRLGRKALLYRSDEAATIVSIYEKFKNIYADAPGYLHVRRKVAAAELDDSLVEGKLDRRLYQSVATKEAWAYMGELLDGKRESYRCCLNPLTRPIRVVISTATKSKLYKERCEIASRKAATVFADALRSYFEQLREIAREIDEEYASDPEPIVQTQRPREAQIGTLPRPPGGSCYRELLPNVSHFRSKNQHRQILSGFRSTRVKPPFGSTSLHASVRKLPRRSRMAKAGYNCASYGSASQPLSVAL